MRAPYNIGIKMEARQFLSFWDAWVLKVITVIYH